VSLPAQVVGYGVGRVAAALAQLFAVPLALGLLGASGYGTYALILGGAQLLRTLCVEGVNQVVVRDFAAYQRAGALASLSRRAFGAFALLFLACAGLVWALAPVAERGLDLGPREIGLLLLLAAASSFMSLRFALWVGAGAIRRLTWLEASATVAVALAPVLVACVQTPSAALFVIVAALASAAFGALAGSPRDGAPVSGEVPADFLCRLTSFGAPLTVGYVLYWIVGAADRYQLAALSGTEATGQYAACYQLVVAPFTLVAAVIVRAIQSRYFALDPDRARRALALYSSWIAVAGALYALASGLVLPLVFAAVMPSLAGVGRDVIAALAAAAALNAWAQLETLESRRLQDGRGVMVAMSLAAAIVLIGNALLIPVLGMLAAALTTLVAYLAVGVTLRQRRPAASGTPAGAPRAGSTHRSRAAPARP
jgi:O-antigen/teichoic acid export membrane protein